jgi:hypothetical protein
MMGVAASRGQSKKLELLDWFAVLLTRFPDFAMLVAMP